MQNEKDFILEILVNLQNDRVSGKGIKTNIPDENLLSSKNEIFKKVMVSALISWYGLMKPFFISKTGIKVNKENYC